jgi:hypothetical protein
MSSDRTPLARMFARSSGSIGSLRQWGVIAVVFEAAQRLLAVVIGDHDIEPRMRVHVREFLHGSRNAAFGPRVRRSRLPSVAGGQRPLSHPDSCHRRTLRPSGRSHSCHL